MLKNLTDDEIMLITSKDKQIKYDIEYLRIKIEIITNILKSKKILIKDIENIIIGFPTILTYTEEEINNNYNDLKEFFKINPNKIIVSNPVILSKDLKTLKDRAICLNNFGLNEQTSIKIGIKFPQLFTISENKVCSGINNIKSILKDDDLVLKVIKKSPNTISFSEEKINSKVNWFYDKGYKHEEIIKLVSKSLTILTLDYSLKEEKKEQTKNIESNMERKYNFLFNELKYTEKQIIDITTRFPIYYTLSLNTTRNRLDNLRDLGFNDNAVKLILYSFPQVISFRIDTLNKKYNYYFEKDLLEIFIKSPKYLMQKIELTDARYNYFIDNNININKECYSKLFLSEKKFKQTYGIDNETLLKLYKEKEGYYEQRTNKTNTNKCRRRIKSSN